VGTRATSTRSKKTPPKPPPGLVRSALSGHGADVGGLACIGLGLLVALGTYIDLAGPVGQGLASAVGTLVGLGRFALPVALLAIGVALLKDDPHGDVERSARAHLAVGGGALAISSLGLVHVASDAAWGAPLDDLRDAGGVVGAAIGAPLEALLAPWGAALVLVVIGLIGLVVLTRTPVRVAAETTANGVRPLGQVLRRSVTAMFELDASKKGAASDDPTLHVGGGLFDQDADGMTVDPAEPSEEDGAIEPAPVAPRPKLDAAVDEPVAGTQLEIDLGPGAKRSAWKLPPKKFLEVSAKQDVDAKAVEARGRELEAALAQHGVETRLVGMVVGPTVTRYELELGPGVKVSKVTSLNKDIAYAMASPDVRILAPIPGRQAIGVEVPNADHKIVALGDLLGSPEAVKANHPLEVAVGRDINGKSMMMNLAQMPHILIAGATGAGKSSCLNSILTSILMRSTPDQVRMILIDPKRVEMGQYDKLPHLLTQVVTDPKKAANALSWAVKEMERRYDLLSEVGVRDITGYNAAYDRGDLNKADGDVIDVEGDQPESFPRLPFVVVVVDELADLMMVAARDVEESICRLAQMARAVGIHLVIATQRPSVNVITGVIKANVPARLAFAVSSVTDSRVILDQGGAERLVGKGDMLLLGPASSSPRRIQGAWVTEDEVRKIAGHWRKQAPEIEYVEEVQGAADGAPGGASLPGGSTGSDDDDDLMWQAMELIVRSQLGSTSMLQRKLKVGFARAGRIMDLLEQRGVVGPSTGSKARDVLMTESELDELLAGADV
jgi:S-DNA-T family DNA segregation ATPase FtsK/SpoIIIE